MFLARTYFRQSNLKQKILTVGIQSKVQYIDNFYKQLTLIK